MILKEELDGIDKDDIGNLEDLQRIVFIHEVCCNLYSLMIENFVEILTKRRSQAVHKFRGEYFFHKHVEYCESVE